MLDTADLQQIANLMNVIVENIVTPRFDLLAEGQADIRQLLADAPSQSQLTNRVDLLEFQLRSCMEELESLKKAQ